MKTYSFPEGFLWGTTTAAHQIEGNNIHSDWWHWEKSQTHKSQNACDHETLYKQDFKLIKKLGHNVYRCSIEWAKLEPAQGKYSRKHLHRYMDMFASLRKKNIKIVITLHHFTQPKWFSDLGGFENAENSAHFLNFVTWFASHLKNLPDYWITFNEPTTLLLKSYLIGIWPPQQKNLFKFIQVFWNIMQAHNKTYALLKKIHPNIPVGMAHHIVSYHSVNRDVFHLFIHRVAAFISNDLVYFFTRKYHDFLGINYYFRNTLSANHITFGHSEKNFMDILSDRATDFGWTMNPKGLYEIIQDLTHKYHLPIFITEHGIADSSDKKRVVLLKQGLTYIHQAIQRGAHVIGYLHWTLLDNFEWQLGFGPKFGIIKVDRKTQKRTLRKSARIYETICKTNKLVLHR